MKLIHVCGLTLLLANLVLAQKVSYNYDQDADFSKF